MIARTLVSLLLLTTIVSGCSLLPQRQVEIISKPVPINIIQPQLPRPINLADIQMSVVSEAVITNPCKRSISFEPQKFDDKGIEQLKRPKACDLSERENPDWPEGYTYLDRFLDEMREQNNGDVVFVATSVGDYKVMAEDMQELKRYIKQLGEVVIYYRNVTMPNGEKGVGVGVKTPEAVAEIKG